jgi:hypothetical protein
MWHGQVHALQWCITAFAIGSTMTQITDPSQLPPALQKFFFTISSSLNTTLHPYNSSLPDSDPQLFQALTELQAASWPVLDIISNTTIPNNTWLSFHAVQELNRIGIETLEILSARILTSDRVPLQMELAAMKDVVDYLELPDQILDEQYGKEVQSIVDGLLDKVSQRLNLDLKMSV